MKWTSRLSAVIACFGVASTLVGCFDAPQDINRVQPNYTDKDVFQGEWYTRQMIVDKQFHTSFPFAGYEGSLDRIRWEITKHRLVAFRSYEKVPGTEGADAGEQSVVAAFDIIKHFDIRRVYNPTNGVESNVIHENDFDRPWYERDYIRVDWSKNVADDFDLNGYVMSSAGATVKDNSNADPTSPWKVRLEDTDGDERVDYLETTINTIAEPDPYACYLSAGDWIYNCHGAEVLLKISFMQVDSSNDYEPLNYPDNVPVKYGTRADPITGQEQLCFEGDSGCQLQELWVAGGPNGTEICDPAVHNPDNCYPYTLDVFAKFGFFRTDRYLFDRENGYTLTGRERLINRWNIWERSTDEDGNPIPYAQRTTKPIVYHTNVNFPEAMWPALEAMANDWDVAFRDTVAKLQGVDLDDVPRIYEARRNSCNVEAVSQYIEDNKDLHDFGADLLTHGIDEVAPGNLEESCAVLEHYGRIVAQQVPEESDFKVFRWEQVGDLRYSMLNWITKSEIAGPLGYGPSAADPLTGEIISANANIYGASLDTYANWGGDIVQMLNGELSTDDIINGTQIREHVESTRARYANPLDQERIGKFIELFDSRTGGMSDSNYLKDVPFASVNSMMDHVAKTGFEEEYLLDTDTMLLFGGAAEEVLQSGGAVSDAVKQRSKPSTWARQSIPTQFLTQNPGDIDVLSTVTDKMSAFERSQKRMEFFGRQNFCFTTDMVEPAVADLAFDLQGKSREEVVHTIRANIFRGVMAHEVGHTIGLRHNFEGSADALNFFPGYWGVTTGDHRDSPSDRPSEVAYSSIMDYHQRFNGDFGGVGLYDKAAIKFGYGELVEVFDEGRYNAELGDNEEAFIPRDWDTSFSLFYASDLPYLLAGGNANEEINELYDEVYDALIHGDPNAFMDVKSLPIQPNPANLYRRKEISFDDFRKQEAMRIFGARNTDGSRALVEVPYTFCSDAYAWGGNLSCNRYDMGTTSEEIVRNAAEMYEFYYPFNAFRQQRLWEMDPVGSYIGRLYSRTYQPMLNAFRYFYYYRRSTASMWPLIRDWSAASYVGLNFFGRVLQTPEPGEYCMKGDWYVPTGDADLEGGCDEGQTFTLGLGEGRYYDTKWNDEFQFRPNNIGHIYDKLIAIQAMTQANAFFFRDFSNLYNRGAFSIGYYRVFQPEMLRLFGGFISQNREAYAPRVYVNGKPTIVYTPLVELPGEEFEEIGVKLKPTDSWIARYYAMFFGMVNLTSNVDYTLDFATRARITLLGNANDPVVDPSVTVDEVVWKDPLSHYVYRAVAADGPELSIGYGLLADAAAFTNDGTDGEPEGAWYTAKRALDEAQAALELAGDDATTELQQDVMDAQLTLTQMNRALNDKVQIIDMARELSDAVEFTQ